MLFLIAPLTVINAQNSQDSTRESLLNKKRFFTLGVATIWSKSVYKGVDGTFFPMPFITYAGKRFSFTGLGMGYKIFLSEKIDLSLNARTSIGGFDPDKSAYLEGMRKRAWQFSAGPAVAWREGKYGANIKLLTDIANEHNGREISFSVSRSESFGKWIFTPSLNALWQSAKMADYYYGIYPAEARAWRPAYKPSDIFKAGASLGVNFTAKPNLFCFLNVSYRRLNSQITNSPIIDSASEAFYIFGVSTKL